MDRLWVKLLVFPLVGVFAFLFFVWLTLPVDTIKTIAEQQAEAALDHKYNVEFASFGLSGIDGIEIEGMTITSKPPPIGISEEEKAKYKRIAMEIDSIEVDVNVFKSIFGTPSASYEVLVAGGSIQGEYAQVSYEAEDPKPTRRKPKRRTPKKNAKDDAAKDDADAKEDDGDDAAASKERKGHQLTATFTDVSLPGIKPIKTLLGVPLTGTINGEVQELLLDKRGRMLEGDVDLKITRIVFGPGVLPFDTGMGTFELKEGVKFGDLTFDMVVKGGKLVLNELKTTGPDMEIQGNGNINLSKRFKSSRAKLNIRVKPSADLLKRTGIGAVLSLNSKVKRAQAGEWYGILLSGPIRDLKPFPSSRTASGFDKIKPE